MTVLIEIVDASLHEQVVQELRAAGLDTGGLAQYSAEGEVAVVDGAADAHRVLESYPELKLVALVDRGELGQLKPSVVVFAVKPLAPGEIALRVRQLIHCRETPQQQKMRLLAMAVNAASDVVEITDPSARLQYVNPAYEHALGFAPGEVMGKTPRELVRSTLRSAGYRVAEASNGLRALELVEHQIPACIVLDLMMPEMDGFQFVDALRDQAECAQVPVMIVTAKVLTPKERKRLESSAQAVIEKNAYSRVRLLDLIGEHVSTMLDGDSTRA